MYKNSLNNIKSLQYSQVHIMSENKYTGILTHAAKLGYSRKVMRHNNSFLNHPEYCTEPEVILYDISVWKTP